MPSRMSLALLAVPVVLALASSAQSAGQPSRAPIRHSAPDVDVRTARTADLLPTMAQLARARALRRVTVSFDGATALPDRLIRYGGYLTGPSTSSPVTIARSFLERNAELYRLAPDDLANLVVFKRYVTKHNGVTQLYLQQRDGGRAVYGSGISFAIDRTGRILIAGGRYYPGTGTDAVASLSAAEAVARSASEFGARSERLRLISASLGPTRRTVFANTIARGVENPSQITAELVSFPVAPDEAARLAWKTVVEASEVGWYESVVDARTGQLLHRVNYYSDSGPQGTVFTAQHPGVTGASRSVVPFTGWVSGQATSGNNTNTYQDLTESNTVEYQTQTPASPDPAFQHFDYAWTDFWNTNNAVTSLVPAGPGGYVDIDAVITQLFYYTNVMHDYLYGFGFDEPSGNFQVNNFGLGGSGGDAVQAEATDGYEDGVVTNCVDDGNPIRCVNNANFGTGGDGSTARMQMFVFETPYRDGSMDGDVIAHEYGHGLSRRLVGGGTFGSGFQLGSMGEGWSDFLSLAKWGDSLIGEYVTGNASTGIRRVNYATSTLGYSDLCDNGTCEVHDDGEIWASALFDLQTALQARYGNATGATRAMQLVVDGMKNTPASPDFLDARDGILAADVADYAGANQCLIWGVFAAREMGFSASSVDSNDQNPNEATDGPASCTPVADADGPYAANEGTNVGVSASGSTENGDGPFTYEWDFDNDGQYDDATGKTPAFDRVGQDGVFTIGVRVTNANGFSDTDTSMVTVANVAPTVSLGSNAPKPENTAVTVNVLVSDPGWLDPLTATIDWGDGAGASALVGVLENTRPNATLTASPTHVYGDNGTFTVEACAADDDTSGNCSSIQVGVTNVAPTAEIDKSAATIVNGQAAFIAHAGEPVPFSGRSTDPGSDDLTLKWVWGDGTPDAVTTYLNNPGLGPDPFPSPEINPRDVTDNKSHTFGEACLYTTTFSAVDDDGGASADDSIAVIIAGNALDARNAGYWQTQYRPRPTAFSEAQRLCYLAIARFMSAVFSEEVSLDTVAQAFEVLFVGGNDGDAKEQLDRQLLTAWLNFANGAFDFGELVDTNGDGTADTAFSAVIANAEAVRLNPASTEAQLHAQKDLLESING
jgi:hypothetical protein